MTTILRQLLVSMAVVTALLLTVSCSDEGNQPAPEKARLRLLHLAYDAPDVDLRVDGGLVASSIDALTSSGFIPVDAGSRRIALMSAGGAVELLASTFDLQENREYTIYAFPPAAAFSASIVEDQRLVPLAKSVLRFVNATTDGGQLELRLNSSSSAIAGPIGQASVSEQKQVEAGAYTVGIYRNGILVADYDPTSLIERTSYTIVVHGTTSTADAIPLGVRVFTDNGTGAAYVDLNATSFDARLTTVNAIIGAPNLVVSVGGTQLTSLGYGQYSPYAGITPGTKSISFTSGGTPIIAQDVTLASRKSYSVFATGSIVPPDVAPLVLQDATIPNATQALVRFINLSPDLGSVDVLTPFGASDYEIPYMQGIGYRGVSESATSGSAFLLLPPSPVGTPYRFKFRKNGTATIAFEVEGVVLEAGKIYTMWVGGRLSNDTQEAYLIKHNQ